MRHKQKGMTALGFIFIAVLVGVIGLAVLKLTPAYMENMRIAAVLDDIKAEMDGKGVTANRIRISLVRRLDIEMIKLPMENVTIKKSGKGYTLQVKHDNRTHYVADIWLVVALDKQVEIAR